MEIKNKEILERESWKCPRCLTSVTDYPAISRRDGTSKICSKCGTEEALFDLEKQEFYDRIRKEQMWLR